MKIKKGSNHVFFYDVFFGIILIIIISVAFLLGFHVNIKNLIIYFSIVIGILLLQVLVYLMYCKLCKTYYVFEDDGIIYRSKESSQLLLKYNQINYIIYYRFYNLFLGNSKGGNLVIYYLNKDNNEECIEISLSYKLLKKLPISNIIVN